MAEKGKPRAERERGAWRAAQRQPHAASLCALGRPAHAQDTEGREEVPSRGTGKSV